MATKHSASPEQQPPNLNGNHRSFWRQAFLAAPIQTLVKDSTDISPPGAAHVAADFADAAVAEERRRFR